MRSIELRDHIKTITNLIILKEVRKINKDGKIVRKIS